MVMKFDCQGRWRRYRDGYVDGRLSASPNLQIIVRDVATGQPTKTMSAKSAATPTICGCAVCVIFGRTCFNAEAEQRMIDLTRRQALGAGLRWSATSMLPARLVEHRCSCDIGRKSGSVSWLIDTLRAYQTIRNTGSISMPSKLETELAALTTPFGAADGHRRSDWTWALRQRAKGDDLKFALILAALGSLMVPGDSPISPSAISSGRRSRWDRASTRWIYLRLFAQGDRQGYRRTSRNRFSAQRRSAHRRGRKGGRLDAVQPGRMRRVCVPMAREKFFRWRMWSKAWASVRRPHWSGPIWSEKAVA
jgi:NitT/TauT family transport system substrate-binding protein